MRKEIQVFKTGATITTSGTSASVAIPSTTGGNTPPKYVRLAATAACYVKLGQSGVTAVAGDLLVQPGDATIVAVAGSTNIAALQVSAAGVLQISPLEES